MSTVSDSPNSIPNTEIWHLKLLWLCCLSCVLVHFHHWLSSGQYFIELINEHRHTHTHKTVWFINTPVRKWQSEYLPQLCQKHLVYNLMLVLSDSFFSLLFCLHTYSKNLCKFLHQCIDSQLLITQEKPIEDTKKQVKGPLLCNINWTNDL